MRPIDADVFCCNNTPSLLQQKVYDMKSTPFHTALLFLAFAAFCPLVCLAQVSREETLQKFHEDVGLAPDELRNFAESVRPLMAGMQTEIMTQMTENRNAMTPELQVAIMTDAMTNVGTKMREQAQTAFSLEKFSKLHLRMFQLFQGTIDASDKTNDVNVVVGAMGGNTILLAAGQPDVLELTDGQQKQIREIQRDVAIKSGIAMQQGVMKFMQTHPESQKQLQELYGKLEKAQTEQDKEALENQIQELMNSRLIPAMDDLKKILADGKAKYWQVLTDRQKAKYEQIMADIPDYLWQRMPQNMGKDREWRPGIMSWVPGMGAPEGGQPLREAPRQRPERGNERRFPGE
jgi:hypothetical protein